MLHLKVKNLKFIIFHLLIAAVPDFILGLKDVSVTVPTAVRRGDNALLICNYDMEGDTLYSVKWYKGRREFYRYTPKENPAMKTFPAPGINVERALSNQSHVVLTSVQLGISGKFSCEVSADAPSFHTVIVSGDMEIVEVPEKPPTLSGIHSRYRLGDTINGNCTSYYSKPAANLTWTINDIPALPHQIKVYPVEKLPFDNLETSIVEINLLVTPQHFIKNRLKLKCVARIHGIYEQNAEKLIEEDRPRILASGRSPDVNLFPYDKQANGDLNEQNELYLTHYKDMTSSASSLLQYRKLKRRSSHHSKISILQNILTEIANFDIIFYSLIFILLIITNNLNEFFIFIKNFFKFFKNFLRRKNNIFQNKNKIKSEQKWKYIFEYRIFANNNNISNDFKEISKHDIMENFNSITNDKHKMLSLSESSCKYNEKCDNININLS